MTEREKMLAGELYDCGDPELLDRWHLAKDLAAAYNRTASADLAEKDRILAQLLGGRGKNLWITPPFYVDYGNNVWIGGGAILLPGVTIGDNVVIGAGSVVTHDIPSNSVAVGSPCRVVRPNL